LISYETVLKFIRTTKTDTGLRVRAYLDKIDYQPWVKLTAAQKAQINLSHFAFCRSGITPSSRVDAGRRKRITYF
jgi:hypothetical protein